MGVPFSSKVEFYYGIWKSEERKCDVFSNLIPVFELRWLFAYCWNPVLDCVRLNFSRGCCEIIANDWQFTPLRACWSRNCGHRSFAHWCLCWRFQEKPVFSAVIADMWNMKTFFRWQSRLSSVLFRVDGRYTAILLDSSTIGMHTDNVTWNNIRMWKYFPGVQIVFP